MQCPTNASAKPSTILTNTTVSTWTADTTYSGYSYRGDISHSEITANMTATVIFANAEASSGNYAPFCVTSAGKVSIYSKKNTSITIPTIRIDGAINYYELQGTVGSDTKPIKIVDGQAVAVAKNLVTSENVTLSPIVNSSYISSGSIFGCRTGNIVNLNFQAVNFVSTASGVGVITNLPRGVYADSSPTPIVKWDGGVIGLCTVNTDGVMKFWINQTANNVWFNVTYITSP